MIIRNIKVLVFVSAVFGLIYFIWSFLQSSNSLIVSPKNRDVVVTVPAPNPKPTPIALNENSNLIVELEKSYPQDFKDEFINLKKEIADY